MFLQCMLQSSVALPCVVVLLDSKIPVCSLGGPEPHPRSQTSMLLGTGGLAWLICTLHAGFHSLPVHAGHCGLEGGTEIGVPR